MHFDKPTLPLTTSRSLDATRFTGALTTAEISSETTGDCADDTAAAAINPACVQGTSLTMMLIARAVKMNEETSGTAQPSRSLRHVDHATS